MVLGCYYLTVQVDDEKGAGRAFSSDDEVVMAAQLGQVHVQAPVKVELDLYDGTDEDGTVRSHHEVVDTTVGRVIFNAVLPRELGFTNQVMDRKGLKEIIARCYRDLGPAATASSSTASRTSASATPPRPASRSPSRTSSCRSRRPSCSPTPRARSTGIDRQFRRGFITEDERYTQTVEVWRRDDRRGDAVDAQGPRRARLDHADHELRRPGLGDRRSTRWPACAG